MLFLLLAILTSALIAIFMRISEQYISNNYGMLGVNYLVCIALSAGFSSKKLTLHETGLSSALILGIICGILYLVSFLLLQWNISKNGVVLSSTFMKLGVLVPTVLSIILYNETPKLAQVIGFVAAITAILLIHFEQGKTKSNQRFLLILLLILGGCSDFMSKVFEQANIPSLKGQFLFFTFLTAAIICFSLILYKRQRIGKMELLFGCLIGIPNYFSSHFLLRALDQIAAVVVYPTFSVGTIVFVTFAGLIFFKEKLSKQRALAIGIILISLVLLNI